LRFCVKFFGLLIGFTFLIVPLPLRAEEGAQNTNFKNRPKIGLGLSGSGARGAAHVGADLNWPNILWGELRNWGKYAAFLYVG